MATVGYRTARQLTAAAMIEQIRGCLEKPRGKEHLRQYLEDPETRILLDLLGLGALADQPTEALVQRVFDNRGEVLDRTARCWNCHHLEIDGQEARCGVGEWKRRGKREVYRVVTIKKASGDWLPNCPYYNSEEEVQV